MVAFLCVLVASFLLLRTRVMQIWCSYFCIGIHSEGSDNCTTGTGHRIKGPTQACRTTIRNRYGILSPHYIKLDGPQQI